MTAKRYVISGKVQGVFYRAGAQSEGNRLGLTGWAMNLPDGRVAVFAQGDEAKLEEFYRFLREGPPGARVEKIDVGDAKPDENLKTFEIRFYSGK